MRIPGVNLFTTLVTMLALFCVASAAIRWMGRRVRGGSKAAPAPRRPLRGVDEASARATIEKLHAEQLVTPDQLATMTPRERELLLLTVAAKLKKP